MPECAFWTLIRQAGISDMTTPLTILTLGAFVLLLSAGWKPLRAGILSIGAVGAHAIASRNQTLIRSIDDLYAMTDFSPREIVSELDRFIVGQADAKRAVSIALRNRWRRLQLTG